MAQFDLQFLSSCRGKCDGPTEVSVILHHFVGLLLADLTDERVERWRGVPPQQVGEYYNRYTSNITPLMIKLVYGHYICFCHWKVCLDHNSGKHIEMVLSLFPHWNIWLLRKGHVKAQSMTKFLLHWYVYGILFVKELGLYFKNCSHIPV